MARKALGKGLSAIFGDDSRELKKNTGRNSASQDQSAAALRNTSYVEAARSGQPAHVLAEAGAAGNNGETAAAGHKEKTVTTAADGKNTEKYAERDQNAAVSAEPWPHAEASQMVIDGAADGEQVSFHFDEPERNVVFAANTEIHFSAEHPSDLETAARDQGTEKQGAAERAAEQTAAGSMSDSATETSDAVKTETPQDQNTTEENNVSRETLVSVSLIEPNREQPRKSFPQESIEELAESMKRYGVLQPLLVKKNGMMYEIIAGERRWRAAKAAGLREIPVIIKNFERQEAAEIALIENIQREDLGPVEEARAYQALIQEFGMTQEELAEKLAKKRTTITNSLRLLKLCDEVLARLEAQELSAGHARCLIGVEDAAVQKELAQKIVDEGLSVRETEQLMKKMAKAKKPKAKEEKEEALNMFLIDIARKLTGSLGTKVQIKQGAKGKGKIEIDYYSEDDLNKIIEKLR